MSADDTTEAPIQQGGADWEIGEAARKFSLALGLDDDRAAAVTLAMSDHAAAVGSKSTQMISGLFTKLFEMVEATRNDVGTVAQQQMGQRTAFEQLARDVKADRTARQNSHTSLVIRYEDLVKGTHEDREQLHAGQEKILGVLQGFGAWQDVVEQQLQQQEAFNAASLAHRTALEAKTDRLEAKTDAYRVALETKIDDIQLSIEQLPESEQLVVVKNVEQRVARVETQQLRILISMWALALVFVVAILISVTR
jgi:hypothetical protein